VSFESYIYKQTKTFIISRLLEFSEEGVGAIKDFFQNISLLLNPENESPVVTKTSVLGKTVSFVG